MLQSVDMLNIAKMSGIIVEEPSFSHTICENQFYKTTMAVLRLNGRVDYIPLIVRNTEIQYFQIHSAVEIVGKVCSYDELDSNRVRHLKIFVFVEEVASSQIEPISLKQQNKVRLSGVLVRTPDYRITRDERKFLSCMISNQRYDRRPYYIPCVAWQENAEKLVYAGIGDTIEFKGSFQSRNYVTTKENGEVKIGTTYEMLIKWLY